MNAFKLATDRVFRDRNMAVDAIWRAGGAGEGVSVRVIRRNPDRIANFGDARVITGTLLVDVRMSEVPHLQIKDTFQIGEELLEVRSDPVRDSLRQVWAAEARLI